jgi:pimeloyl-ACP methyl ester carboxylesterase
MRVPKWANLAVSVLLACASILLIALVWEHTIEVRDAERFPPPGRLIDVGGHRLHILCKGEGRGPVVVMIAGGGTPAVVSYVLQDRIAKFARVCSYDRPGLGWSDPAPHPLRFTEHTDDLEHLLHKMHVDPPYVFAPESFGSLIAIQFASRHPEQVVGIVFLDGAEPHLWFDAMVEQSGWNADLRAAFIQTAWRTGIVRLAFPMLAPPWVKELPPEIGGQMRAIYSRRSSGYAEALEAYRSTPTEERPHIVADILGHKPVVAIVHGKTSNDLSQEFQAGWRASQSRLVALSENGVVVTATNAGHEVAQENPAFAASTIRNVLTKLPGSDK